MSEYKREGETREQKRQRMKRERRRVMINRIIVLVVILIIVLLSLFMCNLKKDDKEKTTTKVNCTQVMDDESYNLVAVLEDNKVVSVSVEATFASESYAESFEKFVSFIGETKKVDTGVKREGTKVSVSNYAPVIESDDGTTKVVVIGESKDTLVDVLVHQNYKCE